jgi:hypothetical protein
MAMTLAENEAGNMVELHLAGKLRRADFREIVPELDRLIDRHGKINVLVDLSDLESLTAGAVWEDLKFDSRHLTDFERVAMVGGKRWQKNISRLVRPFTTAKVRYFDRQAMDVARQWAAAT